MNILTSINNFLVESTGYWVQKYHPKPSIKFAKDHFKDRGIIGVEIGVYRGRNSIEMVKSLNLKKFYLIDPYLKYDQYSEDPTFKKIEKTGSAERLAKKRMGKNNNLIWIRKKSSEAFSEIKEKIDFIYIDGNHEYNYVKEDLSNYYKLVNKGGIISGHDINWPGVSRAVIEFTSKMRIDLTINGCDWWFIKK
jgi:hypothetical protein